MAKAETWYNGPWRYVGLSLMAVGIVAAMTAGALAFGRLLPTDIAITIVKVALLAAGLPGFILNMVVVVRRSQNRGA